MNILDYHCVAQKRIEAARRVRRARSPLPA